MPFDAQGNFTRVMNWQDDAANDIAILASRHDAEDDNFADGFNNTVCRDGRATMTGALKMGNNKITGVANGTAANDVVNKSQLSALQTTLTTAINTAISNSYKNLFPVGSIYVGTQSTCPLASLIAGSTWTKVSGDRVLQTSSTNHAANTTIAAGLPNISGVVGISRNIESSSGAFSATNVTSSTTGSGNNSTQPRRISFSAASSNAIYGNSSTVQPPAYVVNVWRRTA